MSIQPSPIPGPVSDDQPEPTGPAQLWADLMARGWAQVILRYTSHALLLILVVGVLWSGKINLSAATPLPAALLAKTHIDFRNFAQATTAAPIEPQPAAADTAPLARVALERLPSLPRTADLHTLIPTRGRSAVITYTVQTGDTLFGIADKYSLKPETLLWGNYFVLKDDPHLLVPGQDLNILPVDGTYHFVTQGNTLDQIAKFYSVTVQAIIDWGSNNLDSVNPVLAPNTWLVVPGGHRELQTWVVPAIKRDVKTTKANNFGQCPGGYTGAVGAGVFIWPAANHTLSGFDYSSVHHGIDLRAGLGAPLYAVDSGVIVYAGPNDYGYGNLVVIDHGNGWQSVYGHLSQWNVVCGQSVSVGNVIGLAGSTGNSSGPHLHFELRYNGGYVNPWTVLPAP
jgi:LysM repeat protein